MVYTVEECECPASERAQRMEKPTAVTWPWFALMDEALGQSAAVSPLCLTVSTQEDKPGPSTAQASGEGKYEEEEERKENQGKEVEEKGGGGERILSLLSLKRT